MKTLLLILMLCLPVMAQRELWKQVLPALPAGSASAVDTAATDAGGTTCVVIGELESSEGAEFGYRVFDHFMLISNRGVVLFSGRIEWVGNSEETWGALIVRMEEIGGARIAESPWVVLSASPAGAVIAGQGRVITLKTGRSAILTETVLPEGEAILPLAPLPAFKGWLRKKTEPRGSIWSGSRSLYVSEVTEISLWSMK